MTAIVHESTERRRAEMNLNWVKWATIGIFAVRQLIGIKLWLSTRDYPLTPIFDILPEPPFPFDYVLWAIMLIALTVAAIFSRPRFSLYIALGIGCLWMLLDQSRWQPDFIQFMVVLACLAPFLRKDRASLPVADYYWALLPARLFLVCTYFYSGLQKINPEFINQIFPAIVQGVGHSLGLKIGIIPWSIRAGLTILIGGSEAIAGSALLFSRTNRFAAYYLCAMHMLILFLLRPYNALIWHWNIAMMVCLWALFLNWEKNSSARPHLLADSSLAVCKRFFKPVRGIKFTQSKFVPAAVIILFFGIMPAFNFCNLWPSYFSFSIFSGRIKIAALTIAPSDIAKAPPSLRAVLKPDGTALVYNWAVNELGSPPYPGDHAYINVGRKLAKKIGGQPVVMIISTMPHVWSSQRTTKRFFCPASGGPARDLTAQSPWVGTEE